MEEGQAGRKEQEWDEDTFPNLEEKLLNEKDMEFTNRWCNALLEASVEKGLLPAELKEVTLRLMELGCAAGFASGELGPLFEGQRDGINYELTDRQLIDSIKPQLDRAANPPRTRRQNRNRKRKLRAKKAKNRTNNN